MNDDEPPISIPQVSYGGAALGFLAGFCGSILGFVLVRVVSKREEVRRAALWGLGMSLAFAWLGGQLLRSHQGDRASALAEVERQMAAARAPTPPPGWKTVPLSDLPHLDEATQALAEANGLLAGGDRAGAERVLQDAVQKLEGRADPARVADLLKTHARLAMADARRTNEAIGELERAAQLEREAPSASPVDRARTANLLGTALALAGRYPDAQAAFTLARSSEPGNTAEDALATIGLAATAIHAGSADEGASSLARGLDLAARVEGPSPAFGLTLERQASLLRSLGKTEAAGKLATLARTRHPMPRAGARGR